MRSHKRPRSRDDAQLLQIKETDPQQLKDIANAFNTAVWTEETYMALFNGWPSPMIEEVRQKIMAERGDIAERKQSQDLDSLRRDTATAARLLKQAKMDELHKELELTKAQLDYAESRLSGEPTESE